MRLLFAESDRSSPVKLHHYRVCPQELCLTVQKLSLQPVKYFDFAINDERGKVSKLWAYEIVQLLLVQPTIDMRCSRADQGRPCDYS